MLLIEKENGLRPVGEGRLLSLINARTEVTTS